MLKYISGRDIYIVHWMILISIIAQSLWFFSIRRHNPLPSSWRHPLCLFQRPNSPDLYHAERIGQILLFLLLTVRKKGVRAYFCKRWKEGVLLSTYLFFFFWLPLTILNSQTRFSALFSLYVIFLTAFSASSVYQNWDTLINPGRYRRRRLEAGAEKWLAEKSNYGESTYHKQNIQKVTQVYQIIKIIKSYSNCDWLQVATDYRHPGHVLRKSKIRWYRLLVILGNISDFPDAKVMISSSQNPCYY